jgi:hypothetical protein
MPMCWEYTHDRLQQRSGSLSVKSSGDRDGRRGRGEPGTLITNNYPGMVRTKNNDSRTANKLTPSFLYAVIFLLALAIAIPTAIADVTVTQQPQDVKAAVERLPANLANTPVTFTPLQAQFDTATPTRRTPIPAETICRMVMINVCGTDPTSTTLLCASPCVLNSNSGLDPGDLLLLQQHILTIP